MGSDRTRSAHSRQRQDGRASHPGVGTSQAEAAALKSASGWLVPSLCFRLTTRRSARVSMRHAQVRNPPGSLARPVLVDSIRRSGGRAHRQRPCDVQRPAHRTGRLARGAGPYPVTRPWRWSAYATWTSRRVDDPSAPSSAVKRTRCHGLSGAVTRARTRRVIALTAWTGAASPDIPSSRIRPRLAAHALLCLARPACCWSISRDDLCSDAQHGHGAR
jgi:hypothetical protein